MSSLQVTPPGSPVIRLPAKRVNAWPDEGDFGLHPDRISLRKMWEAINKLNLWPWLYNYIPNENEVLIFSTIPEIVAIRKETDVMGHGGLPFADCFNHMNKLAKLGWVEYYREMIHPHLFRKK